MGGGVLSGVVILLFAQMIRPRICRMSRFENLRSCGEDGRGCDWDEMCGWLVGFVQKDELT